MVDTNEYSQLTRRDFLKTGGLTAASYLLGKTHLRYLALPDECGGKEQSKYFKTAAILLDAYNNQDDWSKQKIVKKWLMFNAAQIYLESKEAFLAARLMEHYLYGDGKELDITDMYTRSVVRIVDGSNKIFPYYAPEQEVNIARYIGLGFTDRENMYHNSKRPVKDNRPTYPVHIGTDKNGNTYAEAVFASMSGYGRRNFNEYKRVQTDTEGDRLRLALGRYTVKISPSSLTNKGVVESLDRDVNFQLKLNLKKLSAPNENTFPEQGILMVAKGPLGVEIKDTYDFKKWNFTAIEKSPKDLLGDSGVIPTVINTLSDTVPGFGNWLGNWYNKDQLYFEHHQDGRFLGDQGVANPFSVRAQFKLNTDISFLAFSDTTISTENK